jgi:hypothetical protein
MAEILIAIRARVRSLCVTEREQLGVFSHRSNKEKWKLPFETQTAITYDVKRR